MDGRIDDRCLGGKEKDDRWGLFFKYNLSTKSMGGRIDRIMSENSSEYGLWSLERWRKIEH